MKILTKHNNREHEISGIQTDIGFPITLNHTCNMIT